MARRTFGDHELSPNHEFRRAEIVAATCRLMRTRGVGACSVRGIAEEATVSKGTVNYYFHDVAELVDLSFLRLTQNFCEHVRDQSSRATGPTEAFWRTVVLYVTPWALHPGIGLLWAEYYLDRVRGRRFEGVLAAQGTMVRLFADSLATVGAGAEEEAWALTRHVTGAVLSQPEAGLAIGEFVAEIARLLDLPCAAQCDWQCDQDRCPYHGSCRPSDRGARIRAGDIVIDGR